MDCAFFQCDNFHLSKSHPTSYSFKAYYASKLFYLIHNDVWDPLKITTSTRKKWFVTFIDDHTWLC